MMLQFSDLFFWDFSDFFKKREKPSTSTQPEDSAISSAATPASSIENVDNFKVGNEPSIKPAEVKPSATAKALLPFEELCGVFEKIEATTKRLIINDILTEFFVKMINEHPDELVACIYLCLCKIGPAYEGLELGIGEALLMKAIANATGRPLSAIKSDFEEHGDLGEVAQSSRSNQSTMFKPKRLTCAAVFKGLKEIAMASGQSAVNKKLEKIRSLLAACEGSESKFLFRMLAGKLRIGLAEQSVLIALSHASVKTTKGSSKQCEEGEDLPATIMKSAFNSLPNYEIIIPKLLEHGIFELPKHCGMVPGIPLKPMLAHPTKSLTQVLDRFENMTFSCEYKYDGERAQIHRLADGKCFIYSRNSENMSQKYPDVMEKLSLIVNEDESSKGCSFILDCEVVAWDGEAGKILPFQILSTRKRKDVTVDSVQVRVVLFAFDLLYWNGESLLQKSLRERRELLHRHFKEVENEFYFAKSIDSTTVEDIQVFLDEAMQSSCEGLMVKTLDFEASYEPSKRSRNWLKVKKDYLDGIGDSLDLVVMGGYIGRGKRTGGYGGFLLGCYDPDNEEYQVICKLGTGFSEADLERMTAELKPHVLPNGPKPYYRFGDASAVKPDVWFDSVCVWEVKAADFSVSPIYTAAWGLIEPAKGISLRFPRFIRDRTGEKGPEDATTSQQVAEMYEQQAIINNTNVSSAADHDEDDYY